MEIEKRIESAREGKADLVIENCMLVDVLSGEIYPSSVAVAGGLVIGTGEGYSGDETIDLKGSYLAPGLIDAHVHLESSMVSVPQFAATVVPLGTTSVFTDCHEIANVLGLKGIEYIMESSKGVPLDVYIMLPSCVPATPLESSGAELDAEDLADFVGKPTVIGLGELMNFPGTIMGMPAIMEKIRLFPDGPIDGHAPGLTGKDLNAYIIAGPDSDHECTTTDEAREKHRKGMHIFIREGTGARNLDDLLPVAKETGGVGFSFCTDDRDPRDLLKRGHMDSILRSSVKNGLDKMTAFRMMTVNTAERFRLSGVGAIAPGYKADMVVFDDLEEFGVAVVFKDGRIVAKDGVLTETLTEPPVSGSTCNVKDFNEGRLRLETGHGKARVIEVQPGQIVTGSILVDVRDEGGFVATDPDSDILKIAVVERHKGTGNVGLGLVLGFGLREGALASTVAHDSHNIVVVGASDEDMAVAISGIIGMGGGQVVVSGGEIKAKLPLSIAGLMSDLPIGEVAERVDELGKAAADIGCRISDPFMTMAFMALPVIPSLKITDLGLVDVGEFKIVELFSE